MVFFRVDANANIGMGHVMRCLSIADSISVFDHEVLFVLADENAEILIKNRGYQTMILHTDYRHMESEIWPAEIPSGLIIVDSYYITKYYLAYLRQKNTVVYIDDLAAFPYPVDMLVNYNAYGSYIDYHQLYRNSGIKEPRFILGSQYVPLRKMFRDVPKKKQNKIVQNVLLSTGGSDPEHFALKFVLSRPMDRSYHILLGNMNKDKNKIRVIASSNPHIFLHENVGDMRNLISSMDLAVSAAGSTLYEISACGVPIITYILADNQILGAESFAKLGLAINLGDMRGLEDPSAKFISSIEQLADNYELRKEVGKKMQTMIDGYGADRMVKEFYS